MAVSVIYDVIVLGSGFGGATVATILARHGLRVLMLEAGQHPRFAIGESVVPEFGARVQLLAHAFDVQELAFMAEFRSVHRHISPNSGIKRGFTFMRHDEGREHDPEHIWQFQTLAQPLGPDSHIYRPDLDTWLTALAVRYGVEFRDRHPVSAVDVRADGVRVTAGCGESAQTFAGRFVIDGTGYRSILAHDLGLRSRVPLRTHSRTIFTHVVGMGTIDGGGPGGWARRVPSPLDQGTLHHVFDGGWFWVIPFNNYHGAPNPLCSVGVTLDARRFPDLGTPAAEEFFSFVARFPTIKRQFEKARAVRSFTKTSAMQFHSERVAGDRWCLLPHAAGFVDPLFSGGMTLTAMGVHEVAKVLLTAFKTNEFAVANFCDYEQASRGNLEVVDKIVHGAYIAMRSADLFNAWFRHWAVSNFHGVLPLIRIRLAYEASLDRRGLADLASPWCSRVLGMGNPRLHEFLDRAYSIALAVDGGKLTAAEAADQLFAQLATSDWIPPQFHIADRRRSHLAAFTVLPMTSIVAWGRRKAPVEMRRFYYAMSSKYYRLLVKDLGADAWHAVVGFCKKISRAHFSRTRA